MAITDKNSVLILGAGVSAPFGLPLGGALISDILKQILIEEEGLNVAIRNSGLPQRAAIDPRAFKSYPIHGAVFCKFGNTGQVGAREFKKLRKLSYLLDGQTSETIDDFIVQNPTYAEVTKICVAVMLFLACYQLDERGTSWKLNEFWVRHFSDGKGNEDRNWIHLLINIIRHGVTEGRITPTNKVKIITFNYDQILEAVLAKQFANSELSEGGNYQDFVEILHVHGQCEGMLDALNNPAQTCVDWAKGIHVVNGDDTPDDLVAEREKAKDWVQDTAEIYACGFAFAAPNCKHLGLGFSQHSQRKITYHNYDGNQGLEHFVLRKLKVDKIPTTRNNDGLCIPQTDVFSPPVALGKKLEIANFIRAGYLGDMPG